MTPPSRQAPPQHRSWRRGHLLLLILASAVLAVLWAPAAGADIPTRVSAALAEGGVSASATGVYVWDLDTARPVYSWNADVQFTPASNMKLATTAAALTTWGAEHRFTTELLIADVRIVDGVLPGDLYLRGAGDPSLSTSAYQAETFGFATASLDAFVRSIRALGVRAITGRVVGDETRFDGERTVSSWKSGLEAFCGPLSALTANEGLRKDKRVDEPAVYAAELLTRALRKAGVDVRGTAGSGRAPDDATLLQRQSSAPLGTLLQRMNKHSDNLFAETFLKGLGKDVLGIGSTATGVLVSDGALAAVDIPASTHVVLDGSGLSYGDRLTPHGIVRLLGALYQRPDFEVFYRSLAVAGEDGTLEERMRDTAAAGNARAKTGTLNIATSLSGYVTSADDHLVAFSILITGDPVDWVRANKAQDQIVAALAETRLGGEAITSVVPSLRQRPASCVEPVHTTGSALQPVVQP